MTYKRQTDRLPIIPADAKEHNVTCHYCIVGCGYKAYTWPINKQGGFDPKSNKFGVDLSKQQPAETVAWYSPSMYNVVKQDGNDVHLVIKPDINCVVNSGLGSIRGTRMAENHTSQQRNTQLQRLTDPMVWRYGSMQPTSWDDALDDSHHRHHDFVVQRDTPGANRLPQENEVQVPRNNPGDVEISRLQHGESHVPYETAQPGSGVSPEVADLPVEVAVEPREGGHEQHEVATRLQGVERTAKLGTIVIDVFQDVDVDHGVEALRRVPPAEEIVDRYGTVLVRQVLGEKGVHVVRGLEGDQSAHVILQQQKGHASDTGADFGNRISQIRGDSADDPPVVVHRNR